MKKTILYTCILLLSLTLLTSCNKSDEPAKETEKNYLSSTEFMLDTVVTLSIYDKQDESLMDEVFKRAEELENMLSVYKEGSDLYRLHQKAGIEPVHVSKETIDLIQRSLTYSELSGGLFDVTSGPLIDLWAIDPPNGHVPTEEELATVLPLIDYKQIEINEEESTIFLKTKDMAANLGAIAKGFIVDQMLIKMTELDIHSAIINAGGNIYVLGSKPNGASFNIGVQNPDSNRGEYIGILSVTDKSIVTSGDYERFFIQDGVKYHHILDPTTGYPANNNIKSVSIISDTSTDGDALSTTTLLLGLDKGIELIESLDNVEAIFVTKDNKVYITGSLAESFELTNENYKIEDYQ